MLYIVEFLKVFEDMFWGQKPNFALTIKVCSGMPLDLRLTGYTGGTCY